MQKTLKIPIIRILIIRILIIWILIIRILISWIPMLQPIMSLQNTTSLANKATPP